jgi:hypothetical protein
LEQKVLGKFNGGFHTGSHITIFTEHKKVSGRCEKIEPVCHSERSEESAVVFKKLTADASLLLSMTAYFFTPSR